MSARPAARYWLSDDAVGAQEVEKSHSQTRSEEHTSELQSLMRISYAVFCLKKTTETIWSTHIRTAYRTHTMSATTNGVYNHLHRAMNNTHIANSRPKRS